MKAEAMRTAIARKAADRGPLTGPGERQYPADHIPQQKGVTCNPVYWSERDDWTLAMVAAGLGFAFMPANSVKHPGVVRLPLVEPEFWRQVSLVSVRGRRYSPGVGSLVREAMRKTWFGKQPKPVHIAA